MVTFVQASFVNENHRLEILEGIVCQRQFKT